MTHIKWIAFITMVVGLSAQALPAKEVVDELFEKHFREHYREGECGNNVLAFSKALDDVKGLHLVYIENKGLSYFGMVNAEAARGERLKKPVVNEANWYHHVILMDDAGLVYDFDFTTSPHILPMEQYLETMFLDEPECKEKRHEEPCVGRERKLADYVLESSRVEDVLSGEKEIGFRKYTMGEVLGNWKTLLQ